MTGESFVAFTQEPATKTIGRILHRTAQAIKKQASRMGLRKKKSRK